MQSYILDIAFPGNLDDLVLLLHPNFRDSITFIVLYNVLLSLSARDCPPTKNCPINLAPGASLSPQKRGGGYCKLSHASLTQHLSETQFFTRQRGWARGRETSEEQTMVWQLFSCLLSCHSICQSSTLGRAVASTVGCKELNEGGRRGGAGLGVFSVGLKAPRRRSWQ